MDSTRTSIAAARIKYFFKETFRAHSKAEYREVFQRGLNEDNSGITGSYPFLYVRAFFALLILFTVNVVILRATKNVLYVPTVVGLGGVTFILPFTVLLYELYPKRDFNLFMLLSYLVIGGTASGAIVQLCYAFIHVKNEWLAALVVGVVEELGKIIPAGIMIARIKNKNSFLCFLVAAAVGAGFSVIEDMGYIFHYADMGTSYNDIGMAVGLFFNRGLSTFCTHILWTGAIGWAFGLQHKPFRAFSITFLFGAILVHSCWDLPVDGWLEVVNIAACALVSVFVGIIIIRKSLVELMGDEDDLTHLNEVIIKEAKEMGERMRFTNAANLTFSLVCTLLAVFALTLCSLPIGVDYVHTDYASVEDFVTYIEGGYNLKADFNRPYDLAGVNKEARYIDGELVYVIQEDTLRGYDGTYWYCYYVSTDRYGRKIYEIDKSIMYVELPDYPSVIPCHPNIQFVDLGRPVFEVNADDIVSYSCNSDGTVTAIMNAEEFEGYDLLIALMATGVAIAGGGAVILFAFTIKLRRVKDDK